MVDLKLSEKGKTNKQAKHKKLKQGKSMHKLIFTINNHLKQKKNGFITKTCYSKYFKGQKILHYVKICNFAEVFMIWLSEFHKNTFC